MLGMLGAAAVAAAVVAGDPGALGQLAADCGRTQGQALASGAAAENHRHCCWISSSICQLLCLRQYQPRCLLRNRHYC
eukprot:1158101-Pelagomonas_calceolata.AAC.6